MTGAASAKEIEQNCPCFAGFSTDTTTFLEIPQTGEHFFLRRECTCTRRDRYDAIITSAYFLNNFVVLYTALASMLVYCVFRHTES